MKKKYSSSVFLKGYYIFWVVKFIPEAYPTVTLWDWTSSITKGRPYCNHLTLSNTYSDKVSFRPIVKKFFEKKKT